MVCDKAVCVKDGCVKDGCVTEMVCEREGERGCVTKCERGWRTEDAKEEPGGTDLKTRAPHNDAC